MRRAPAFLGLAFSALVTGALAGGALPGAFGAEPTPSGTPEKPAPAAKAGAKPGAKAKTKGPPETANPTQVTLQGDLTCAKCGLHESSTCQSVLVVKPGTGNEQKAQSEEKDVKYYLARNAVADAQHEKVCGHTTPVTVTGVVTEEGGRKVLTASSVMPR